MSFSSTSSRGSTPSTSLCRTITSQSASSNASSHRDSFSSTSSNFTNPYSSCAYASDLKKSSKPSAYVSDEDLFGDDEAYLSEPPPPPRSAEVWLARPLLPPVNPIKPRKCITEPKKKRSASGSSKRKV